MKLLTPKAAVGLQKKANKLNELMALAGAEDPETLIRLARVGAEGIRLTETTEDFDPDSGILIDEDWVDLDSEAQRERLRRIGEAGERSAFQAAVDYFKQQRFTVELNDGSIAVLKEENRERQVTIHRPDTGDFKQPGWDISILVQDGAAATCYYMEVKTHTPKSRVHSRLPLSDTQMRQAALYGDTFILLLVIYDEALDQVVEFHPFRNVIGQMAAGAV